MIQRRVIQISFVDFQLSVSQQDIIDHTALRIAYLYFNFDFDFTIAQFSYDLALSANILPLQGLYDNTGAQQM